MAQSDPNSVLRKLPIAAGIIGGSALLLNRLLTPALTDFQARSDVMGGDFECPVDSDRLALATYSTGTSRGGHFGRGRRAGIRRGLARECRD